MKILVTGANGYIGSKVVNYLFEHGFDVIATDISNKNLNPKINFIESNLFEDKSNWFEYFGEPDVCLHLAWRDGFVHNSDKHMLDLSAHYKFCTNLISNGLKTFVGMGTMHEVGYHEGIIDENTNCKPLSQYGISKNALRASLEKYCNDHECKFMWLRAFYIYGDDEFGNSIFCKIRQAVRDGKTTFPFTTGKNQYDFIHVDELAKQIALASTQTEVLGIINVCSGKPISLAKQVEWYIKHNNLPIILEYGKFPDRPYDSPCIYGDNTKISKIIVNQCTKLK